VLLARRPSVAEPATSISERGVAHLDESDVCVIVRAPVLVGPISFVGVPQRQSMLHIGEPTPWSELTGSRHSVEVLARAGSGAVLRTEGTLIISCSACVRAKRARDAQRRSTCGVSDAANLCHGQRDCAVGASGGTESGFTSEGEGGLRARAVARGGHLRPGRCGNGLTPGRPWLTGPLIRMWLIDFTKLRKPRSRAYPSRSGAGYRGKRKRAPVLTTQRRRCRLRKRRYPPVQRPMTALPIDTNVSFISRPVGN
jgi:hypothetical protein